MTGIGTGSGALDLAPLEEAAAKAGLPGLKARLVPPDPRRGRWFVHRGDSLLVNERVVERLAPPEGQALVVNSVLQWKHVASHRRKMLSLAAAALFLTAVASTISPGMTVLIALLTGVPLALRCFVGWTRAVMAADDESVELLGDPEVLVRALNTMNQDRLDLGGKRVDARPDLHRRAERLVDKHQLRLPPERRTVPVLKAGAGCGAGWEATGAAIGAALGGDAAGGQGDGG